MAHMNKPMLFRVTGEPKLLSYWFPLGQYSDFCLSWCTRTFCFGFFGVQQPINSRFWESWEPGCIDFIKTVQHFC